MFGAVAGFFFSGFGAAAVLLASCSHSTGAGVRPARRAAASLCKPAGPLQSQTHLLGAVWGLGFDSLSSTQLRSKLRKP